MRRRYGFTIAIAAILLALVVLRRRRRLRGRPEPSPLAESQRAAPASAPPSQIEFGIGRTSAARPAVRDDDSGTRELLEVAIMRGDGGRWVYATIPLRHIDCDNAALLALLFALDVRACDRPEVATLDVETVAIGSTIAAEFGDAPVVAGLWLHPNFAKRGFTPHVADVIANRRSLDSAFGAFPRPAARDESSS